MPLLVRDCPRCGADEITFDVFAANPAGVGSTGWLRRFETFSVCRRCGAATVFYLELSDFNSRDRIKDGFWDPNNGEMLNRSFRVLGYISTKDLNRRQPPEHLPPELEALFNEGAACLSISCFNAAGTMFRLCLDVATRALLPDETDTSAKQPSSPQRRNLGLRIPWLIQEGRLPEALTELARTVREDGNDGAHAGSLSKEDAEDLLEFTEVLLERLYTEPAKLALAEARRIERRQAKQD